MNQEQHIDANREYSALPKGEFFDEIFNPDGNLRNGYESIIPFFRDQPEERLRSIKKRMDFVLKEQGITFGEARTSGYVERSWYLDMIPHIINEEEFKKVEAGTKQRLIALNMFLQDIYSEQRILRDKVIPLHLVLGDKNYLRDCVNVQVPRGIYLHLGAFDLLRKEDGNFVVLDDNLTIPSGVSYAMVNRQVMRQQFPALFNNMQIRQIWDTPALMLSRLRESAPKQVENPNIVILSPGIYNEAYSEHELLASRMGIPLVLPKDLIVKENCVYMKTVSGVSRVDVIYRRIQDYFIDPVCFFEDSVLGVPGIFSCVRHGNVTVANAIGCGVVSSKALLPYSDKIIEYYLSEKPVLETVETFLLEDEKERNYVFDHITKFVVKTTQGTGGYGVYIGEECTKKELEELKALVDKNPFQYVAQPLISLSHTRVMNFPTMEKRYVETRFFTFLGSGFSLSSCALTRVSPRKDSMIVTNSRGGGSKDTWIMGSTGKVATRFIVPVGKNRSKDFILSRVAESLFWLGRYVNRSLMIANVLQVMYTSEIDILLGTEQSSYNSLIRTISRLTGAPIRAVMESGNESLPWYIRFFNFTVHDKSNPYSMHSNLTYAMNNAREIQNMLSNDMWISLRKLLEFLGNVPGKEGEGGISLEDLLEWLSGVVHYSQSFYGATLDTFSRQDTMEFIQLGRYMEHCNAIVQVLKSTIQYLVRITDEDDNQYHLQPFVIVILKFLNSFEAYQWSYESRFDPYLAYRMIVVDREFSNSLVSCLENIKRVLQSLNPEKSYNDNSPEHICDMLISRCYSFDLKGNLGFPELKRSMISRGRKFFDSKTEITPGFWASDLKAGVELLGIKIMDRYSNLTSTTPFTVNEI
jgi:uncharacterized circularly permuted ATP-grasp superfamily protein/uncharacterized alpha-E superfamily protein